MKKFIFTVCCAAVITFTASNMFASESYYEEHGLVGNVQEQPGAPVANTQRPAFNAANIGLDVIRPGLFGVINLGGKAVQNDGPGGTAAAATQTQSGIPMNSMIRWEHSSYKDVEADSDRVGITLRGAYNLDYFSLNVALPIERVVFDDEFSDFSYTRAGLVLTPRFNLLKQEEKGVDLSFGVNAFYMHTWFDQSDAYNRIITTDQTAETTSEHVGIGPIITLVKDFDKFTLGLGAIWQRGMNIGGDEEFFDDSGNERQADLDVVKVGMNIGVPIGDNWLVNGTASYNKTLDNHPDLDEDWVTVGIGATYVLTDKWTIDTMFDTDLGADDLDSRYQFSLGAVWSF
ncbi:MAG: hypothetical protein JXR97_02020 [Planctomycetes bacterium]|nr:hypothetical protein [Planctomycetota bacterium]